jgi:hypothetical protein
MEKDLDWGLIPDEGEKPAVPGLDQGAVSLWR